MTIGEMIREKRKESKLTQKELGDLLSVSSQMIAQYENNKRKPKISTLRKICYAMDMTISDLGGIVLDYYSPEELEDDIPKLRELFPNFNNDKDWTIGIRIQQLRQQRGFTRDELSIICGLPVSDIEDFENEIREPTMPEVEKIARGFDMSVGEFVSVPKMKGVFQPLNPQPEKPTMRRIIANRLLNNILHVLNDDGLDKIVDYAVNLSRDRQYVNWWDVQDNQKQESDATTEKTATTSTSETVTDNSKIITDNSEIITDNQ